jgi:hypothetical protein
MAEYITRITQLIVLPDDQPIFSEMATTVTVIDDAGGEFVEIEQHGAKELGKLQIGPAEWPALRAAIDQMVAECRPDPEDAQ